MTTNQALERLTSQRSRLLCLVQGGKVRALVTFDPHKEELVFRLVQAPTRVSIRTLLFQTQPEWLL